MFRLPNDTLRQAWKEARGESERRMSSSQLYPGTSASTRNPYPSGDTTTPYVPRLLPNAPPSEGAVGGTRRSSGGSSPVVFAGPGTTTAKLLEDIEKEMEESRKEGQHLEELVNETKDTRTILETAAANQQNYLSNLPSRQTTHTLTSNPLRIDTSPTLTGEDYHKATAQG